MHRVLVFGLQVFTALALTLLILTPLSAFAHDHDRDSDDHGSHASNSDDPKSYDREWHDNDWCSGGRFDGLEKLYQHIRSKEHYKHYQPKACGAIDAMLVRYSKRHPEKFCELRAHLLGKGLAKVCNVNLSDYKDACGECSGAACSGDCNKNGIRDDVELDQSAARQAETCSDAEPVYAGQTYSGDTKSAKANGVSFGCSSWSNGLSPDVYYKFRAAASGTLRLSLTSNDFTPLLSVTDRCQASWFDERSCAVPQRGKSCVAELKISVNKGGTYFIRVSGTEARQKGRFTLTVDGPGAAPAARDCDNNKIPDACQPDSDKDGVPDSCDNCPEIKNPDQADSDEDDVGNACDACGEDGDKSSAGVCGCGVADVDANNDGQIDCVDTCPSDPVKSAPGICGCGVADVDTDGDGSFDCNDACPSDSAKVESGQCGCGTADTDSDSDGIPDCHDTCPTDGDKLAPGLCGCGTADTDSDNDGDPDCGDLCPLDSGKSAPGACGCGNPDTDFDHDGVADCLDLCPADGGKTAPGLCGCGTADTDSDNDGTADCNETCPVDATKTAPGICGCGVADVDTDSDGIADCNDSCAADAAKSAPGTCGCGVPDTDSDHDGTADCLDQCSSDSAKVAPGQCGCGVADTDSDNDGMPDCQDQCPTSSIKTAPGVCGCGTLDSDADLDGVFDCNDLCPADGAKSTPGACGCGVIDADLDHDGTADCLDRCPSDPLKSQPGSCGCGTPDTDSDRDGTPDCSDSCPSDPAKLTAGACGCGFADTDSDNDGTPNCKDSCPSDSGKSAPGVCGCGLADTDTDHDGVPNCNDLCPTNSGKTAPGVCGCGTADVDSDHDGTLDCTDSCPLDGGKTSPGTCGCGVADADANHDGVLDCICSGTCDLNSRGRDEDGDGVSNCDEIDNHTLVCDKGSFVPRLEPAACLGANGFFDQTNIASIVNHLGIPISVLVEYRDAGAVLRGQVSFTLGGFLKTDININQLGLLPNTYGTACVTTSAPSAGSWSGGITIYKPRYNAQGQVTATYDYALYYPFANPHKASSTVPLNTNSLGVPAGTLAANWIRLIDAVPNDGVGLGGSINYYNQSGALVRTDGVSIGDGGAFDFAGHEGIGANAVGMAQFVPSSNSKYFIQSSRYFYEGGFTAKQNFYAAFSIPDRPPTGATITARLSRQPQETSVVEMVNGSAAQSLANFNVFNASGGLTLHDTTTLQPKATLHRVVYASMLPANAEGTASISGPIESLTAITVIYRLNSGGQLLTAFAPPFAESAGKFQIADFNTFIGNTDTLQVFNSTTNPISANVRVIDYAGNQFTIKLNLGSHASSRTILPPPLDSYGTIVVDASDLGLIIRNDIERPGQYVIPISGR